MNWIDLVTGIIKKHKGDNRNLIIGLNLLEQIIVETGQKVFEEKMGELNVKIQYAKSGVFEIRSTM